MKDEHQARPVHRLSSLGGVFRVELRAPRIERVVEAIEGEPEEAPQRRHQSQGLVAAGDVDGEELQQIEEAERGRHRHHLLAIARDEQGVAMVVAVAESIHLEVEPPQEGEDAKEPLVEPSRPEHRRVAELVAGGGEERGDGPLREERGEEAPPDLVGEEVVRREPGYRPQAEVPQ